MLAAGIDIGTTTISGAVLDTESGRLLCSLTSPGGEKLEGAPWAGEQSADDILKKASRMLERLREAVPGTAALGLTGQMHGVVYLDREGRALGPLYTWEDGRGDLPAPGGLSWAGELAALSGYKAATGYGLFTHYYNMKNGLVPPGAVSLRTAPDYVAMRLCGLEKPRTHASLAASLGLFDLDAGSFDHAALARAGLPADMLPEAVRGEALLGETAGGLPVALPIGDNQAGFLGAAGRPDDVLLNLGTSSQLSALCPPSGCPEGLEPRPYIGGARLMTGAGLCGGSALSLLNGFLRAVCSLAGEVGEAEMYGHMQRLAEAAPRDSGLSARTTFRGTREHPGLRGAIEGLSMDNFTPEALCAAFYRGVCEELLPSYRLMPESTRGSGRLVLCGNAARLNRCILGCAGELFARPAVLSPYPEDAAAGAAKLAGALV